MLQLKGRASRGGNGRESKECDQEENPKKSHPRSPFKLTAKSSGRSAGTVTIAARATQQAPWAAIRMAGLAFIVSNFLSGARAGYRSAWLVVVGRLAAYQRRRPCEMGGENDGQQAIVSCADWLNLAFPLTTDRF